MRAAEARENERLAAALAAGRTRRERAWCGFIAMGGPIMGGECIGLNLYLEPGAARFDVVENCGHATKITGAQIARRLKQRMQRLRVPTE